MEWLQIQHHYKTGSMSSSLSGSVLVDSVCAGLILTSLTPLHPLCTTGSMGSNVAGSILAGSVPTGSVLTGSTTLDLLCITCSVTNDSSKNCFMTLVDYFEHNHPIDEDCIGHAHSIFAN